MPSGDAAAKARQRERNGTASGSSGTWKTVARMQSRPFDEIADEVEHAVDFAGKITDARILANNSVLVSLVVPVDHLHDVMDLVVKSRNAFTLLRAYHVPLPVLLPDGDG